MQKTIEHLAEHSRTKRNIMQSLAPITVWQLDLLAQKIVLTQQLKDDKDNLTQYDWSDFLHLVHAQDKDILLLNIKNAINVGSHLEIEFRVQLNDQTEWFAAHANPIDTNKLFGVFVNISNRRKHVEFLSQRQSQLANLVRVSSLGEIASMLSHEISQPLVVINTYIAGCIRRMESDEIDKTAIITAMKKANEHVELAGTLIHRLKNYFRKNGLNYERVHIHDVIKGAMALLTYERRRLPVTIDYDFDQQLPCFDIDRLQIKFVILGLVHNSIDAVLENKEKAQKIIIQTRKVSTDMLEVSVIDFGQGITSELKKKLFNTYCTTKPSGSGLTLIICRGIIEAHNGEISVEDYEQKGTKFTFTLPLTIE